MIDSVAAAQRALPDRPITLYLLLQNCEAAELDSFRAAHAGSPFTMVVENVPRLVPLSVARNILLRRICSETVLDDNTLVAFPDDDCWYPAGFLESVVARFEGQSELDFWFCKYGSKPIPISQAPIGAGPDLYQVVRNASSNTIFFRGTTADRIGLFDEGLGVGTLNGSGEDLDFALRGFVGSRKATFVEAVVVGHRDKHPEFRRRYYRGSLIVLARHIPAGAGFEWGRKLAVGLFLFLRRELSAGQYVRAIRDSLAEYRSATKAGNAARLAGD